MQRDAEQIGAQPGPPKETGAGTDEPYGLVEAMQRFESPLLRYVSQLLGANSQDVEEVVQDTFLRLNKEIETKGHASIKNLSSWLFRVAHNLAMDAGRRRRSRRRIRDKVMTDPVVHQQIVPQEPGLTASLSRKEACRLALEQVQTLPEEQKTVLLLKMIEGLTLREISEITGMKMGTVNYRLSQALKELSCRLRDSGVL